MHKEYIQATWNADVSTARILLETKEKRKSDDGAYKAQFKQKRKRSEKKHAARFETVKQESQDSKSGKTYGSGVALRQPEGNIRKQEGKEQMSAIIVATMIIKGKAVHSGVHSMYR